MNFPTHVGIIGGGRMGACIAHTFLAAGAQVTIVEQNAETAAQAAKRIGASLNRAAERGRIPGELAATQARLDTSTDETALAGVGFVVEAVSEDTLRKVDVLTRASAAAPGAVLATSTRSLSVDAIADHLPNPARFLGLHFLKPIQTSDLIEIVVGHRTDSDVIAEARKWVAGLSKTAITVADSPGFASSRLSTALSLEAMRMVQEGVASATDIDIAMTFGHRHRTGPLKTTDIIGLDVRLAMAERLAKEFGRRFDPPEILRDMVTAGKLGRTSGQGFYPW